MYLVGGSVRDIVLGRKPNDFDIVMACSFPEMEKHIVTNLSGIIIVRKEEFGTLKAKIQNRVYDFTICRTDGKYTDHRHPNEVKRSTLQEDLRRRDFTMNAIAIPITNQFTYDLKDMIDPYHGTEDIKNGIIRCIEDPQVAFQEDPLRILRALRFSITLNFQVDEKISEYLKNKKWITSLKYVSEERIVSEITKCFKHNTYTTLQCFKKYPDIEWFLFHNVTNLWLLPTTKQK